MRDTVRRIRECLLDESAADYVGLYELVWDIATNAPDVAPEDRVGIAQELVRELLTDHGASLYRSKVWPPVSWEPIPAEQWNELLEQPESWTSPDGSTSSDLLWIAQ